MAFFIWMGVNATYFLLSILAFVLQGQTYYGIPVVVMLVGFIRSFVIVHKFKISYEKKDVSVKDNTKKQDKQDIVKKDISRENAYIKHKANKQVDDEKEVTTIDIEKITFFSMKHIDTISQIKGKKEKGDLFERYCAKLLEYNGFKNIQVVGGRGDLGADIIAWKGSRKFVIQCKCYQGSVPYHALEQTVTARKNVNAGEGIILTNSYFTEQTKTIAPEHQIYLWDRNKLQKLIDDANEVISYYNQVH